MDNYTLTHILNATSDFKRILEAERVKAIRSSLPNNRATLKVGDRVLWSHAWASYPIKVTTVKSIVGRDGESMESAPWSSVVDEVIVDIEDGSSWAYGYQIAPIIEGQNEIKVVA